MQSSRLLRRALSALVAVVAIPASLAGAASVSFTASPTTVGSPTPVASTASLPASGATSGTKQEITQAFNATYLRLGGASQVTAPEGWTTTFSTDGASFGAAPTTTEGWAAVRAVRTSGIAGKAGGSATASVATPASAPFTGSTTGGDGWNVFFDNDNHVFGIWHHNGSNGYNGGTGGITCNTRTGGSCGPGWPFYMTATGANAGARVLNTGSRSEGWVDDGRKRLWFPTNDNGTNTGVACIDISDLATGPRWCGGSHTAAFVVLGSAGPSQYSGGELCRPTRDWGCADGLAMAGSRMYTIEARTGKLLCADLAANGGAGAPCPGQPYAFPGATAAPIIWGDTSTTPDTPSWAPVLMNVNGNIVGTALNSYTSQLNPVAFCASGATGAACPGWETPKALPARTWFGYAQPDASGVITGVCFRYVQVSTAGSPTCFSEAGASITGNSSLASTFRWISGAENSSSTGLTVNSRVLWAGGEFQFASPLYCSDAATDAVCAGWPVSTVRNYAMVVDPRNDNCFWTNGHYGEITQIDITGQTGCTTVPGRASFTPSQLVATERVSCTNARRWSTLSVTSPARGTYSSATLTVLDADGQVVVSGGRTWQNVPIAADGTIDISGLAQADTGTAPQFVVNLSGRTNDANIATTITAPDQVAELCMSLTPQQVVCPSPKAPAGSLLGWTTSIAASGVQGSTTLTGASSSVRFRSAATAKCTPTARITVTPNKRVVSRGGKARIAVKTCNTGLGPLTAAKTSVRIPKGLTVTGRGTATLSQRGRVASWSIGDVAPHACVTRYLTVRATTLGPKALPGVTTSTDAAAAKASGVLRVGFPAVVG